MYGRVLNPFQCIYKGYEEVKPLVGETEARYSEVHINEEQGEEEYNDEKKKKFQRTESILPRN
jgi:hypothetical protein